MISGLGKVIVITQYMCYNARVIDSYIIDWQVLMQPTKLGGYNVRDCIRAICTTVGDTLVKICGYGR